MIPKSLQPILWSVDTAKLDLKRDEVYIIHQVLAFGRSGDLKWLFSAYPKEKIRQVFLEHPEKNYIPASLNFVANFLLGLDGSMLDESKYVQNTPRNLG